jgi:hypothetical protein
MWPWFRAQAKYIQLKMSVGLMGDILYLWHHSLLLPQPRWWQLFRKKEERY